MDKTFELLIKDHKKVKGILEDLLATKANAHVQRTELLQSLKLELLLHEKIEEEVVYPLLKGKKQTKDLTLEGYQEHHVVDMLVDELEHTDFKDELWKAKVTVLQENLLHHIKEEESELFPDAKKILSTKQLNSLQEQIKAMKIINE